MTLFDQNICEVQVHYKNQIKAKDRRKISCSRNAFIIMQEYIEAKNYQVDLQEHFFVLLMDRGNHVKGISTISIGGMSGTVADPKLIYQLALKTHSASIILCHNHPSGNTKPSESDIRLTQKLKKAGSFLDLPVLDHIIISDDTYFSFADEGIF